MYPDFVKTRLAKNLESVKDGDVISNVRLLVEGMGSKISENWFFETNKIMASLTADAETTKKTGTIILHDEKGEWSDYYEYDPSTNESTLMDSYRGSETYLKIADNSVIFKHYGYSWETGDDEDKLNIPEHMVESSYETAMSVADTLKIARLLSAWKVEEILTSGSKEEAKFRETEDEYNLDKRIVIEEAILAPGVKVVDRRWFYPNETTCRYNGERFALVIDDGVPTEAVMKALEYPSDAIFETILEMYFPIWSKHLRRTISDIVKPGGLHWGYPVGEFADWYMNLGGKDVVWSLHEKLYPLLYRN